MEGTAFTMYKEDLELAGDEIVLIPLGFPSYLFTFSFGSEHYINVFFSLRVIYPKHIYHRDLVTLRMCWN
jgi:hypothetical protein